MLTNTYTYNQFRHDHREHLSRADKERLAKEAREERDSRKRNSDQE
jgi:hypothetical protein